VALGSLGLALLAGLLSILSPCVLPLLPIVFGAAASEHRAGPVALAAGVALSFVAVGLFIATVGFAIGLDGESFRIVAAILMVAVGVVLLAPGLQVRLATAGGPISNWADQRINAVQLHGVTGQFSVGLLLGAVWSPCVGPTLGAASVLAAEGKSLHQVALTMIVFGIGASAPLAAIGYASRQALARQRHRLIAGARSAKIALGALLILFGAMTVSGFDRRLETALVDWSPQWLTDLTTRF
jgi:cytochrome c-type biogenesis protein